ncbi:hypothetical protein FLJC2902T_13390 [Flavobacterium limnosediminis JC2902]|uniref:Uncharacterized protein n=1 Tax=Flavobacterium limnosediminis JC2902 TaxID=1341181 RepID=V6SWG6_9FLAO|nr:hypothetical protein [Flavobacterium limnosediminis]ESU28745.1 hypothetical protein FLJC2902T_13390 [Flavobacterium limnosediminis JC2902]
MLLFPASVFKQQSLEKLTNKLENRNEFTLVNFINKHNKVIRTSGGTQLTKKDEIDIMDKEIDKMVYELYGLNKEKISIVENSKN